jgi:perosamine synthetase
VSDLAIFGGAKAVTIPQPHFHWPDVTNEEIEAVKEYMLTGKNCDMGYPQIVKEFEDGFRDYHGIEYALSLNSGTSALHTGYFALGVKRGDEVIVPSFTFPATALPILSLGGIPVLCDCLKDTANISPKDIERKITKNTKVIAITHQWGHPCEMDEIMGISEKYGIPVLEDCAHSPGAMYRGKYVGTFGTVSCFSFDNNKLLASGEAGMILTSSKEIFERSMIFSDFGARVKRQIEKPELRKFKDTGIGLKYRIHPHAAAIANQKVKKIDILNSDRVDTLDYLTDLLNPTKSIIPPVTKDHVKRGGYYGYKPIYQASALNGLSIKNFIKVLQAEGVDIRQTVSPALHKMELFRDSTNYGISTNTTNQTHKFQYDPQDFPNSEWFMKNHLSFPTFSHPEDRVIIDQYVAAIHKVEKAILSDGGIVKQLT